MRLFTAAERRDAVLDVLKPYESDKLSGNTFIKTPTFDEDYKVGQALKHLALVTFPTSRLTHSYFHFLRPPYSWKKVADIFYAANRHIRLATALQFLI